MNANQIAMTLALLAVAPLASATHEQAATHEHEHHAQAASAKPPTLAQRWSVDAPLQTGIGKVRAAVERVSQSGENAPARAEVRKLALEIETQVQYLIANCTLEPEADAALHGIIGRLLGATSALKSKPDVIAPVAQLRAALADYPKYFDDPGWVPLGD